MASRTGIEPVSHFVRAIHQGRQVSMKVNSRMTNHRLVGQEL